MKTAKSTLNLACLVIVFLMLCFSPMANASAKKAVVHAVLFWSDYCGHCHYILEQVLPPLQQKYGDQLQILFLEVSSSKDNLDRLFATAKEFGMSENEVGVPFMVIGDQVLLGSDEIANQLPLLIEEYLARGGVDYPRIRALQDILPEPSGESPGAASISPEAWVQPAYSGIGLAAAILIGIIAALVFTGASFWRAFRSNWVPMERVWLDRAIPILSLIGLAIAGYLFYVEAQGVRAVCGPVGDCNAVQTSRYAKLFGFFPTSLLGILGYLAIMTAWGLRRLPKQTWETYASLSLFGMSLFGALFSLYLTYLEIFVLRAVCIWCLSSAVVMTLLMLLSIPAALRASRAFEEAEEQVG